jgi:hypothetical protein
VTIDGVCIGFTDHFNTRLVTTSNFSAIANLHALQIKTAHTKPSLSASTGRFSVMDLNNGDYSASVFTSLLYGEYPTTELLHPGWRPSHTNLLLFSLQSDLQLTTVQRSQSHSHFTMAVYRQSVRLGAKPLETHGQNFFFH